jgi:tryptophanyl-tRNA synthetase
MLLQDDFRITPYKVEGKVDYEIFAKEFGIELIDKKLEDRIARLAGESHYMLRRHIFFSHRDLNWLLDEYEKGNKFYLYTGIAPSGAMTLGHLIPFTFTKWLQDKFDVEVYMQIPDEEKYLIKGGLTLERVHELAYDDAMNIIALGFDPKKTKIFFDTEYAKTLYKQAVRVAKHITFSMVKDAFGFSNENNVGSIFYTSMQAVPSFLKSVEEHKKVPCLIPLAIDQDVHFRITRDTVAKMGYYKPAIMHAKFLPGLSGIPKMSASDPNDTIYLNDGPEVVEKKVYRAITGQQPTAELQRKLGGDPDKCAVCQLYKYLFEQDDKKLEKIFEGERKGTLLAGEHKKDLAKRINAFLEEHRKRKEKLAGKLDDYIIRD